MTTEQTNLENSDAHEASAQQRPVSETGPNPASPEESEIPTINKGSTAQTEEYDQGAHPQNPTMNQGTSEVREEIMAFSFPEAIPLVAADATRPFTDFIEEFRQAEEARVVPPFIEEQASSKETAVEASSVEEQGRNEFIPPTINRESTGTTNSVSQPSIAAEGESHQGEGQAEKPGRRQSNHVPAQEALASQPVETPDEQKPPTKNSEAPAPSAPAERPVSPLLRPATRLRLPRHGSAAARQQREEATAANRADAKIESPPPPTIHQGATVPTEAEARQTLPASESSTTPDAINGVSTEPSRPARRYRFDRPASSASTPAQPRIEEGRDTTNHGLSAKESKDGNGHEGLKGAGQASLKTPEALPSQPPEQTAPETPVAHGDGSATPVAHGYDNRRQPQGRQRGQEQSSSAVPPAVPEAEAATPPAEPGTAPEPTEVALEDLPPLEYADLQRASSRRRRRRRPGEITPTSTPLVPPADAIGRASTPLTTKPALPEPPIVPAPMPPAMIPPRSAPTINQGITTPSAPPSGNQYNIVSGYTVSQMNQGNEDSGPFMSPEPSPARGSSPVRGNLRAVRAEVQRPMIYPARTGDPAINQLANTVVQAIQAQTDRMVNELRRSNQGSSNISVTLPPFPSTERVGVFVDVANLLYSARTLRITIDFAKLLDFLRGNRRLVRAQAYCPTSPHSSEDQMFLQAVKGLGYRITTKNYKTFSSGAKKADLDLDLCMDVVRLVDGRAVDCIVLVSGDSDFMPMLDYCSDHGVRVEVAAFDEAMSATLRQSCDLFINLAMLEEIRA